MWCETPLGLHGTYFHRFDPLSADSITSVTLQHCDGFIRMASVFTAKSSSNKWITSTASCRRRRETSSKERSPGQRAKQTNPRESGVSLLTLSFPSHSLSPLNIDQHFAINAIRHCWSGGLRSSRFQKLTSGENAPRAFVSGHSCIVFECCFFLAFGSLV